MQGEMAIMGKPLYTISDLEYLKLKAYVLGSQLSEIKLGQKVKVLIDGPKGELKEIAGKIIWISESAEFTPKTIQTREERVNLVYAIKVKVKNDGSLKIGMPGEVIFSCEKSN
jgi:HlyD family secretion protein